jgi:hypothetical protein
MTSLRDAYEKGGGSLGVNKNLFVPKTQDELFARYKNTGGSKAALDYLMGKTPYSPYPIHAYRRNPKTILGVCWSIPRKS